MANDPRQAGQGRARRSSWRDVRGVGDVAVEYPTGTAGRQRPDEGARALAAADAQRCLHSPWATVDTVASAHGQESSRDVVVEAVQMACDQRHEVVPQSPSATRPLVVVATTVVIRTVEAPARDRTLEPAEGAFVAGMHPDRHLALFAVTSEVAFAYQQAE
jgi:hypothetical protein